MEKCRFLLAGLYCIPKKANPIRSVTECAVIGYKPYKPSRGLTWFRSLLLRHEMFNLVKVTGHIEQKVFLKSFLEGSSDTIFFTKIHGYVTQRQEHGWTKQTKVYALFQTALLLYSLSILLSVLL